MSVASLTKTSVNRLRAVLLLLSILLMFSLNKKQHSTVNYVISPPQSSQSSICESIINPINLTTLIIMSYTNNEALMRVLSQYNDCKNFGDIIYEIVIVWNNPNIPFLFNHTLLYIDNIRHKIAINVYQQKKNSLANRWFISRYHKFKTLSAIFIDDDMFINQYSIKCMLSTFNQNRYKIIAPSHSEFMTTRQFATEYINVSINEINGNISINGKWKYKNIYSSTFNMLLPHSMFNTEYLPKLALIFEEYDLLSIIDDQIAHCDDISMMLSMAMLNDGKKYLLGIDYILIDDYGKYRKQPALTNKAKLKLRYKQRSQCLTMIMNRFININKNKHKNIINPIVQHDRKYDTINCHNCTWCHHRSCRLCNNTLYNCYF